MITTECYCALKRTQPQKNWGATLESTAVAGWIRLRGSYSEEPVTDHGFLCKGGHVIVAYVWARAGEQWREKVGRKRKSSVTFAYFSELRSLRVNFSTFCPGASQNNTRIARLSSGGQRTFTQKEQEIPRCVFTQNEQVPFLGGTRVPGGGGGATSTEAWNTRRTKI